MIPLEWAVAIAIAIIGCTQFVQAVLFNHLRRRVEELER